MRLLIVEDEMNILKALEKGLKKDGYAVDTAINGEEAETFIAVNEYDLILLDINLPDIDGYTLLKNLRIKNADTRVMMVSANRTIDDRIKGLDLGANDYMVKPFDFQELKARIRALLRRDFASQPNVLMAGGLEVDMSSHQVRYENKPMVFTLKEYSILKYLMQNKGRVISAEELFEHIWNDEADAFSEVMRVHIYSLRKKLNNGTGNRNFITTIKGAGYLFNGNQEE